MIIVNVTCRTEDCSSKDLTIPFPNPEDLVICGGCHQEITDKTPADTKES
jgi:hypothetical protein